jgi:glycosyltransferase involved in cell wall biosynthesis
MTGALNTFIRTIFLTSDDETGYEKKVLFVANAIVGADPGVSGGESRFIELGKQWQKAGYEVHLLAAESGVKLCKKMGMDVFPHVLSKSDKDNRFEFIIRTLQVFLYLPKLSEEYQSGIVYSTSEQFYDVLPGIFLKIMYPRTIAFASAVHWLPPILFWKRKSSMWYNSLLFMLSERAGLILAYLSADALFPVSKSTYDDMKKEGLVNKNTVIVKCGVNLDEITEFRSKYIKKENHGVFMKRIQAVKGIFDLIEIWEHVVKEIDNAQLVVIGAGIDENQAKGMVNSKNLQSNIHFTGVIYDVEEKFKHIIQSKLFILPSYEENWAIVIGEAMAAGVPVLCYDLKELREVWQDSVIFVPVGNKEEFALRIVDLLSNGELYEKTVDKGLEYIKQYDWTSIARDELNIVTSGR